MRSLSLWLATACLAAALLLALGGCASRVVYVPVPAPVAVPVAPPQAAPEPPAPPPAPAVRALIRHYDATARRELVAVRAPRASADDIALLRGLDHAARLALAVLEADPASLAKLRVALDAVAALNDYLKGMG